MEDGYDYRRIAGERLYKVTGKKQRVWIFALICFVVLVGLVYVLSQFG